jgi:DHA1 family inner membrane transport protein
MKSLFPKVAPDGMVARVLLSFLATAGLYYVNIMPAIVDGLKEGLSFSNKDAGLVASCNVYGAACGSFLIAFFVRRINWRKFAPALLFGLISLDLISMTLVSPVPLMIVRFAHGCLGGALVGIGFSVIARTKNPDRTFGMLLVVQAFAGGLGVMSIPLLVASHGTKVLFIALIMFSVLTYILMQFLPEYARDSVAEAKQVADAEALKIRPLILALFSVFLFQAANMGLYAYIIGLGKHAGLDVAFISESLGAANWIAIAGAGLVVWLSTSHGLVRPLAIGMVLTIAGTALLFDASSVPFWLAANVVTGITWNFVIAYLLGMCARFDSTGVTAVWGGFASKMGLASGPMLAAFVVGESQYALLIALTIIVLFLSALAALIPARMLDTSVANKGLTAGRP